MRVKAGCRPLAYRVSMEEHLRSELDVRTILSSGQDPFPIIEERVRSLTGGEQLILLVPFEPTPLYTRILSWGASYQVQEKEGVFRLIIERRESAVAVPRFLDLRQIPPEEFYQRTLEAYHELPEGCLIVHLPASTVGWTAHLDARGIQWESHLQADQSCQLYLLKESRGGDCCSV